MLRGNKLRKRATCCEQQQQVARKKLLVARNMLLEATAIEKLHNSVSKVI